jgi:hypothetical protein
MNFSSLKKHNTKFFPSLRSGGGGGWGAAEDESERISLCENSLSALFTRCADSRMTILSQDFLFHEFLYFPFCFKRENLSRRPFFCSFKQKNSLPKCLISSRWIEFTGRRKPESFRLEAELENRKTRRMIFHHNTIQRTQTRKLSSEIHRLKEIVQKKSSFLYQTLRTTAFTNRLTVGEKQK